jgi:hypothetical protein
VRADELACGVIVAEISPAEDRAEQAQPPPVRVTELDGDIEGLVIGQEPMLRGE